MFGSAAVTMAEVEIQINDLATTDVGMGRIQLENLRTNTVFYASSDEEGSISADSHEQISLLPKSHKATLADRHGTVESIKDGNETTNFNNNRDEIQIVSDEFVTIPPPTSKSIQSAIQIAGGVVIAATSCNVACSINNLIQWTPSVSSNLGDRHSNLSERKSGEMTNTGNDLSEKTIASALQIAGGVAIAAAAWNPTLLFPAKPNIAKCNSFHIRKSRSRATTPRCSPKSTRRARSTTPNPPSRQQPSTEFLNNPCK